MAAAGVQGSWFPSGYYGHFRSKSRADFVCEYRHLARPTPPNKFVNRSRQPTRKHVFSHHDNKEAFLNDALIFQQGLGRRRVPNSTYQFKNDFITWMPEKEYIEKSRPFSSTYRQDYMPEEDKTQILIKRPKTSFDGVPTTSYRYAHGTGSPNKTVINAMNNNALQLSLLNRKERAMTAVTRGRETVASCLTWAQPRPKSCYPPASEPTRHVVPPATQTTEFVPHPPSVPRQSTTQIEQRAWPAPTQQQQAPPIQQQAPPTEA